MSELKAVHALDFNRGDMKKKIKLLSIRCEICGEDDRRYVFASPLTARVICMKCAKEAK